VEILFKIPQESIKDISMKVKLHSTIEEVKKFIEKEHQLKPLPNKQKIFFAGKLLSDNKQKLSQILQGRDLS